MKISFKLLLAAGLFFIASSAVHATTTLRFSVTGTNRATGFANFAGTPTDGMQWGILIDTAGDGFQSGNYDVFNNDTSGFLAVNSVADDDYFFTQATLTATLTATGSDPGGAGGINSAASAPNGTDGIIPGVTTGDAFAIIWFESLTNANGTNYGVFSNGTFQLPASGSFVDFNTPFLGGTADPAKPASFTFGGAPIPEPSRLMLLGLGGLGLVFRRRRA